jgi:mono/diheme cytochrome c family protein
MKAKFVLPAIAFAALLAALPAHSADDSAAAAYQSAGCWGCHGHLGQGGRDGPQLARTALSYEAFSAFVRTTTGNMPPFSARVVPEEELRQAYAYLQSIPEPPDAATIPLLQDVFAD